MSLTRNVVASYASQTYVTLIGIVMVPLYIRYMGIEAYGLVGLFVMLQVWFQLLDMGLTATISREAARHDDGGGDALGLRRLLRLLEVFFVVVGALAASALGAGSGGVARHWLNVEHLPLAEVELAVRMMGALVALRWICGLYRGAISGFERLVWLGGFNAIAATARFVLVIPYFLVVGSGATDFFRFQLMVAVLELAILIVYTYRLLPKVRGGRHTPWKWQSLRGAFRFSMGIALTSSIWVFVTQTDKLILSKLLPLSVYAYFSLAVLVASTITLIGGPISAAVLPRMARLCAEDDNDRLVSVYRGATQLVGVLAVPVTLVLAIFGQQLLWAWTGDAEIANQAALALTLYSLGNGFLVLSAMPYYLQFAKGDLKLHVIGHMLFVTLLIPAMVLATMRWGVTGAGFSWLIANAAYFIGWVPMIHRRFFKNLHSKWLLNDLGPIIALTTAGAFVARLTVGTAATRLETIFNVAFVAVMLLLLAAAGSTRIRTAVLIGFRAAVARTASP